MAAKGSIVKNEVFNKMLEMFPGSFMYNGNKELRINMMENGELVQLKVALTAAKEIVEGGDTDIETPPVKLERAEKTLEPTDDEKAELKAKIASLF